MFYITGAGEAHATEGPHQAAVDGGVHDRTEGQGLPRVLLYFPQTLSTEVRQLTHTVSR